MATEQEYRSILIPNQPFRRLKIADYISQGKKKKLFKGEYIRTSAKTIDDLYYYYIDEGQIVATFERESGEVAPLYWRNAGNAFSAEYNDYASIGRYKARFIAAQNTVLFAFTQRQLYELSQDDPELFYEFINVCHMSFAQMGHRISNTGYQSSTKRMIMWLQKLCATQECDEHGVYDIECKLTLQQLSTLPPAGRSWRRWRTRASSSARARASASSMPSASPNTASRTPRWRTDRSYGAKSRLRSEGARSAPIRDGRGARTTWRKTLTFPSLMQSETTHHRP